MTTIVILGAGQLGQSAGILLNRNGYRLLAFGDNAPEKCNPDGNPPVLPVSAALAMKPERALVAVAGFERGSALEKQARALGYSGDIVRLDTLMKAIDIRGATAQRIAERIEQNGVPGAIAELGVYRGDFARLLNEIFPDRRLYLFDTFLGFDIRDTAAETAHGFQAADQAEFADTSIHSVLARMPHPERVIVQAGYFPETAAEVNETFAFVSLDADLYAPTLAGLQWFWPQLSKGGVILLHDYNNVRFPGVKQAATDFERATGRLALTPLGDLHGSAVITRI